MAEVGGFHWAGAPGPPWYAQTEDERVVAILYWTDSTPVQGEEPRLMEAGWYVVYTDNGDTSKLEGAPAIAGLSDAAESEAIDGVLELASKLIREEL